MGKFAFGIVGVFFLFLDSARAEFIGCPYYCEAYTSRTVNKAESPGEWNRSYNACMVMSKDEGKCGSVKATPSTTTLPETGPIPEARPTNTCSTDYKRLLDACVAADSDAIAACDESNSGALKNAADNAQANSQNQGANSSVQNSCGQTNKVSQEAKDAMTSYRDTCSGAVSSCNSSCQELSAFLKQGQCLSSIGLSQSQAQELIDTRTRSCQANQSKVDDANRAVASYSDTSSQSQNCQSSSAGLPTMPQGQSASATPSPTPQNFCQLNPLAPGCGSAAASCDDPSQASNKVCVCARSPRDPMCTGSSSSEFSSNSPSIDSSSRVPSNQADPGGDIPGLPDMVQAKVNPSGDSQSIDGRQNTAALGGGGGGGGSPQGSSAGSRAGGGDEAYAGGGSYGGGGGGGFGGTGSGSSGAGGAYARQNGGVNSEGNKNTPDLRQFLPGGAQDPKYKLQGSGNSLEKDGVTGPHSSNWRKIQNRYQILKTTLEP